MLHTSLHTFEIFSTIDYIHQNAGWNSFTKQQKNQKNIQQKQARSDPTFGNINNGMKNMLSI